jgi:nickel superoxide dismutase
VYDPASARIAGEAVLSMTKKILALDMSAEGSHNTYSRYVAIKEEQADDVKRELCILWHDYFKPEHLEAYPDLHTIFWNAAKQGSTCKTTVSVEAAETLMGMIENIHNMFWESKGRDIPWYTAS